MDVLAFFANPTVRDIGAISILAIVVIMILTGRLIPKSTHERELEAADKRTSDAVARGDEWKQTAKDTEEVNAVVRAQNGQLIEANRVVEAFLRSAGPAASSGGA